MSKGAIAGLRLYVSRQAAGIGRYLLEQSVTALFGWIPSVVGIGLRALFYRLILKAEGYFAIEHGVRLAFASGIRLGRGAYLDHGVYLHACPGGISLGDNTLVMANAILHVYNFRGLPHAGIRIGRDALIGEASIIRGQGGVTIGDNVYTAPLVQILAVNHVFGDPTRPIIAQGITAEGIVIEDDCWIGAGAIITDGVTIGRGSVIGAGAVVTRSIPPHSLAVGVPARVVRDLAHDPAPAPRGEVYL
ncbi:MAG: acyltransferase [Chloroflexi bacterium]|nr:acyltransferase [Chloroflexota bacterium]